jgi:hypothetical protein
MVVLAVVVAVVLGVDWHIEPRQQPLVVRGQAQLLHNDDIRQIVFYHPD